MSTSLTDIPPKALRDFQSWIAAALTHAQDSLDSTRVNRYIQSSESFNALERLKIHQNIRLRSFCNLLHRLFPFSYRLLGPEQFEAKIAHPYLREQGCGDWNILNLGKGLPEWVKSHYSGNDRELVLTSFYVDEICDQSFRAKRLKPLEFTSDEGWQTNSFLLQPYVHCIQINCNLLHLRKDVLQEFVESQEFPVIDKSRDYYYLIYRNDRDSLVWEELQQTQFIFLKACNANSNLKTHLEWFEREYPSIDLLEIHEWIYLWMSKGLFASNESISKEI